jgi:hypothetical protein
MLTKAQRAVAKSLFIRRPDVVPGTRAIVNRFEAEDWFKIVTTAIRQNGVKKEDVTEFCDIAGVPD